MTQQQLVERRDRGVIRHESSTYGNSVDGVPLAIYLPKQSAEVVILASIHGDEAETTVVVSEALRCIPRGELCAAVILCGNPDGILRGTRGNARGVDLNRNFPLAWRPLTGLYYSGPRALSEPESRIAYRLMLRLRPAVSIWYHQHLDLVDESGGDVAVERRYAALVGLPAVRLTRYPGSIVTWENTRFRGSTAFVVELPAGEPSAAAATRFARAVDKLVRR